MEPFSLQRRMRSLGDAWRGVVLVVRGQHNAWIHIGATAIVIAAGAAFGISRLEWALLTLATAAVWSAEAMNTAVEALGDSVSPERSESVGLAKDVAAGAVLLSAAGAVGIGVLVFGPRLVRLLTPAP